MNTVRGIANLVAAIIHIVILITFINGVFYPSKLYIVTTILISTGVFLSWSARDFERATNYRKVGGKHSG